MKQLSLVKLLCVFLFGFAGIAQAQVTGVIRDENGEALVGANVVIEGTYVGTTTNFNGEFTINPNFSKGEVVLVISSVGYKPQKFTVQDGQRLEVGMEIATTIADEVVVSASRVEENILEAPVTVEKIGLKQLETQPTAELFSSLGRYKGVDVNQSSLLLSSMSTRGFNSAKSERLIQLVDYVDYMSPSLSLYAGNVGGLPELDIESVEIIYGANSALYGSNAFNGVVVTHSKDPFKYEGVSASIRGGSRELFEGQLRFAKKLNDRLAIKLVGGYFTANDFVGENQIARNAKIVAGNNAQGDPRGWDAMHRHGESVVVTPNSIVPGSQTAGNPAGTRMSALGFTGNVFLPGFTEQDLTGNDFKARSLRLSGSLHYLITDEIKASAEYRISEGSGIYQSSNRYAWERFEQNYLKFEVAGDNWFVRAYRNEDKPGETYDLNFLGLGMQVEQPYAPGANPTATEQALYPTLTAALGGQQNVTYATMYSQVWSAAFAQARQAGQTVEQAYQTAAQASANIIPRSGDARFNALRQAGLKNERNFDPSFENNSRFWDFSAQYAFDFDFMDVIVGGSYRTFNLTSKGTLFSDGTQSPIGDPTRDAITNYEWGAYAQLKKVFLDDRLSIALAGRVDNFKNFDTRFSPRISAVYTAGSERQHNFRASYAQAFRAPAQIDQYIHLDIGSLLLLSNIGENQAKGFNAIPLTAASGGNATPFFIKPLELEQMNTWEIGYKGVLFDGFYIDLSYYQSNYTNFIGTQRFFGRESGAAPNLAELSQNPATLGRDRTRAMQVWLNSDKEVVSQGFQVGIEYYIAKPLNITTNYTWSTINEVQGLILGFNTPEHKVNFGVNGEPFNNFNYSMNVRWQTAYDYFMPFDEGKIDEFATFDAQLSYKIPSAYTTIKVGGTNLLDAEAIQVYGAAPIGRIIYAGATFDLNFQ